MVNMPQAGLLDKGRLPNEMQGVLLEEQAAGGVLLLMVCVTWACQKALHTDTHALFPMKTFLHNNMQTVLFGGGSSSSELRAALLKGGGCFLMACKRIP